MKKLEIFENETYRRKGGGPLSSADKKKVKEICALYDKGIVALQNDLDQFTYFNMGFMLGRKDMELQMLGFEPCDTDSAQHSVSQSISEKHKTDLSILKRARRKDLSL